MYIITKYSEYKRIKKKKLKNKKNDKRTNNLRIYILSMQDLIISICLAFRYDDAPVAP